MLPRKNVPTVLSGASPKSCRSDIGRATLTAGVGVAESRIGPKESETRIEATMNSAEVAASPKVSRYCAPITPRVWAIM